MVTVELAVKYYFVKTGMQIADSCKKKEKKSDLRAENLVILRTRASFDRQRRSAHQIFSGSYITSGAGAIIGDGDRKLRVHAKPSKMTNVLFLAKIAPPSTS